MPGALPAACSLPHALPGPHLQARAHDRQRVGHKLRQAAAEHARAQDHGGGRVAVVRLQHLILQDLKDGDVHAGVGQDADLQGGCVTYECCAVCDLTA